jgi:hypothetical protein
MPRKLTELQLTKKHIRTCHDLVDKIEKELADEGTDRSERTRLLTSLAKLNKEIRGLENKKAKLAKAKPHGTRLIGFHNLENVFKADRCLKANYRWNGRTLTVVIPDAENQMSMPRYPAYVASRDAAEKIARSLQGLQRQSGGDDTLEAVKAPEPLPKIDFLESGCTVVRNGVQQYTHLWRRLLSVRVRYQRSRLFSGMLWREGKSGENGGES